MIDSRYRRLAAWAVSVAAFALSCAVSVPPSGGPEDKTPPSVATTVPAADSVGVATDTRVAIEFSESMTRARVERQVTFEPPIVIGSVDWDGSTILIAPEGGLHPDTTYVVTVEPGFQDHHRVAAKEPYRFAFATSAHIDSGQVKGIVLFRREPTKNGVVDCYALPVDTGFAPGTTRPDRRGIAGDDGRYTVDYLATDNHAYLVWAFEDKKGNRSFDPGEDVGLSEPDTVWLRPDEPVAYFRPAIVDPNEPALVAGSIVNSSGVDTMAVSVRLSAVNDTVSTFYYALCDTLGAYRFETVHGGRYLLSAFIDVYADSLCGTYPCGPDSARTCAEPCAVHPDTVVVEPGDKRSMRPIELGPARAEEEKR